MGGVEDKGPPAKRVKGGLFRNSLSAGGKSSCVLSDPMARILATQEDEVVGSKGIVRKVELARIIADALYSLGYCKTGALLEEESGISLHTPVVELFMHQILDGQWDESIKMLDELGIMDETAIKLASFVILEHKFLELLHGEKIVDALKTLKTELVPLGINNGRIKELSSLVLFPSQSLIDDTNAREFRLKSREKLVSELRKLLPPWVMVPEKRLVHLVEQALVSQKDSCRFHNSSVGKMSLLTDHQCGREHIPSQTLQILHEHGDEVWFLQFSHNGKYLASSSGDGLVIIWEVMVDETVFPRHKLSGHEKPVSYISWSPNDDQLLTCGTEESVRRWDATSGECLHVYDKSDLGLVSCAWAPGGKRILSGVTDKSIRMWDLEGKELECWKGPKTTRIADLGITTDGKELITVCKENMIQLFGFETKSERFIEEDQTITSFALSEDGKSLLISLWNEELHVWNIDGCLRLVAKYIGHKRSRFVVRSCFGGSEQAFIASGSEDSQVYIWHKISGDLILTLSGHSGAVNCVSWNPMNPYMLASASDDRTIRIWGLNKGNLSFNRSPSNGIHCCKGGN